MKVVPSNASQWSEASKRRGPWLTATSAIAILIVGCLAYIHLGFESYMHGWDEDLGAHGFDGGQRESSKGSQYLLGVGKADITG